MHFTHRVALILLAVLLVRCGQPAWTQRSEIGGILDSGGALSPEQAAYDVTFYELSLDVDPDARTIGGSLTAHARIVDPLDVFVLNLDTVFTVLRVDSMGEDGSVQPLRFENRGGRLRCILPGRSEAGDAIVVRVTYEGAPRVARTPPWDGGFTWARTRGGDPWIATSVQGEGADLWWPCKDHPSDEPDSFALHITVPRNLTVASNGRLRSVERAGATATYHWFVSTPINNYGVALHIAPYQTIEGEYESTDGSRVPVGFWVLPEDHEKGRRLFPQLLRHLAFYEKYLGPYPFRADKYGVAQTPFLGMEHQSIIAYGSDFTDKPHGYDWLHHHELGHEWWGNMVTAADWNDFWIHEGFCTYMQALYSEELYGKAGYLEEMSGNREALLNRRPIAPEEVKTTDEMYFLDVNRRIPDNDIYFKGAWVLHSLRWVVGDEAFFHILRRMAYPTEALEKVTDGRQCRFATTQDFISLAETATGKDLDWFFRVYLRQAALPKLKTERREGRLHLSWEAPDGQPFPMPVEVRLGGATHRVEMPNGTGSLGLTDRNIEIDPHHWLLKAD